MPTDHLASQPRGVMGPGDGMCRALTAHSLHVPLERPQRGPIFVLSARVDQLSPDFYDARYRDGRYS